MRTRWPRSRPWPVTPRGWPTTCSTSVRSRSWPTRRTARPRRPDRWRAVVRGPTVGRRGAGTSAAHRCPRWAGPGRRPRTAAGARLRGTREPGRARPTRARRAGAARTLEDMPEFIYQMRAVRKSYGDKVVLDDVTLAFLPGAKIGVVGPNGTGKSSLLRMMAGVEQPSNG